MSENKLLIEMERLNVTLGSILELLSNKDIQAQDIETLRCVTQAVESSLKSDDRIGYLVGVNVELERQLAGIQEILNNKKCKCKCSRHKMTVEEIAKFDITKVDEP